MPPLEADLVTQPYEERQHRENAEGWHPTQGETNEVQNGQFYWAMQALWVLVWQPASTMPLLCKIPQLA